MHSRHSLIAPLHRLMAFAHAVHVRRMIEKIAVEPKQTFWIMTLNLLIESATIEWCKVFGAWNEQTHWTQAFPKADHNSVRAKLLLALAMDAAAWEAYRDTIVDYRNHMIAHHDLDASVAAYPQFDPGLKAATFMFDQLRAKADQDWLGGIPTSLDRWAHGLASNMQPIVIKSFEASAVQGSNVQRA
jgi:hypothetical protein